MHTAIFADRAGRKQRWKTVGLGENRSWRANSAFTSALSEPWQRYQQDFWDLQQQHQDTERTGFEEKKPIPLGQRWMTEKNPLVFWNCWGHPAFFYSMCQPQLLHASPGSSEGLLMRTIGPSTPHRLTAPFQGQCCRHISRETRSSVNL